MDFFEQQETARRTSRRLLAAYVLAAALTAASYGLAAALLLAALTRFALGAAQVPWPAPALVTALAGAAIAGAAARRWWQLREGGAAVARLLDARPLQGHAGAERRLLNVVEEMAIASGVAVPPVHLMADEPAVNALVAGYSPNEAVIIVTRGALERLSREELQGVMGHEFSHLLNGDMALNLRLAALLAGLTWLGEQGEALVYAAAKRPAGSGAFAAWAGAGLAFVGFPGTLAASALRAAVSRQRELLADAAAVQFTRDPDAVAGALDSILALSAHT
ncbi:MAG TPA: M48 family metalloprotease, partial [Burkholderiales bacterium]|nr:M48 family metalloprotease [Burkholderiales bacterium]